MGRAATTAAWRSLLSISELIEVTAEIGGAARFGFRPSKPVQHGF